MSGRGKTAEPHGDDDRLLTSVVAFLAEGLRSGEPAIAIAAEAQLSAIARRLALADIDVEQARGAGTLTFVDAHRMLDVIIVDGEPDAARFTRHVGSVIDAALRANSATLARLYSGMVDSLWTRGQDDAATQLEYLFYGLARTHAFSLLCAHAMAGFYDVERAGVQGRQSDAAEVGAPAVADRAGARNERTITGREEDVLRRTALGQTNKDIANGLNISVRTVEAHKANAMRKLGLAERVDVIRFAMSKGWLATGNDLPR